MVIIAAKAGTNSKEFISCIKAQSYSEERTIIAEVGMSASVIEVIVVRIHY